MPKTPRANPRDALRAAGAGLCHQGTLTNANELPATSPALDYTACAKQLTRGARLGAASFPKHFGASVLGAAGFKLANNSLLRLLRADGRDALMMLQSFRCQSWHFQLIQELPHFSSGFPVLLKKVKLGDFD